MYKKRLPAVHPGEILREEFLAPLRMSAHELALALRVPATRINDIVNEKRGITADTALRLSRYFGTTARFWLKRSSWRCRQCACPSAWLCRRLRQRRMSHAISDRLPLEGALPCW